MVGLRCVPGPGEGGGGGVGGATIYLGLWQADRAEILKVKTIFFCSCFKTDFHC